MNRLRTKWGKRWLVVIMLTGLIPLGTVTVVQSVEYGSSYADWVRRQLREPADDAIEKALAAASVQRARSFEAFLLAFVEAFDTQQAGTSLGLVFAEEDLSTEALLVFLQDKYRWRIGDAAVPEVIVRSMQSKATQAPSRWALPPTALAHRDLSSSSWASTHLPAEVPAFVLALSTRFAAQPLGP